MISRWATFGVLANTSAPGRSSGRRAREDGPRIAQVLEHLAEDEGVERLLGPRELDLLDIAFDDLGQPLARLRRRLREQLDAAIASALSLRERERAGRTVRAADLEDRRLGFAGSAAT